MMTTAAAIRNAIGFPMACAVAHAMRENRSDQEFSRGADALTASAIAAVFARVCAIGCS
jgi:hypothetical protein